jgi:hypothetical protein
MTSPEKLPLAPALRSLLDEEARSEHPTAERLIDYQSGWLTAEESGRVEAHLRACQECKELLADLAAFEAHTPAPKSAAPPDREAQAAWKRLQAEISGPEAQRSMRLVSSQPPAPAPPSAGIGRDDRSGSLRRQLRFAYALAASLACVAVGLVVWGQGLRSQVSQLKEPKTNLILLELRADAERGGKLPQAAVGDDLVFLLYPPDEPVGSEQPPEYRARIQPAGQEQPSLWIPGLYVGKGGELSFDLTRSSLAPGDYQIDLFRLDGQILRSVGSYRFSVAPGKSPT